MQSSPEAARNTCASAGQRLLRKPAAFPSDARASWPALPPPSGQKARYLSYIDSAFCRSRRSAALRALRLTALLTSVTRDFSARVFCQTLYNKAECKHCRAQAADRSLSPDKCATQQRTRHSPNRAPFIHQFTNSNNDDQYNTTPSNTPSRASLSSGARSCKSGPAPARKQPRRPSLDWPARCPGRANGTSPRPTGATTYPLHR